MTGDKSICVYSSLIELVEHKGPLKRVCLSSNTNYLPEAEGQIICMTNYSHDSVSGTSEPSKEVSFI